jgi:hypothetical protein
VVSSSAVGREATRIRMLATYVEHAAGIDAVPQGGQVHERLERRTRLAEPPVGVPVLRRQVVEPAEEVVHGTVAGHDAGHGGNGVARAVVASNSLGSSVVSTV